MITRFERSILCIQVFAVAVRVWFLVHWRSFDDILQFLKSVPHSDSHTGQPPLETIIKIVNAVSSIPRFPVSRNCLRKSILLYYFLTRAGAENLSLVIGVATERDGLVAHSWVNMSGVPLEGDEDSPAVCSVLYSFGGAV